MLGSMAPKRAVAYIESFDLPEVEKRCLIECDIRQKSHVQVGEMLHISVSAVKKRRKAAYRKITDDPACPFGIL